MNTLDPRAMTDEQLAEAIAACQAKATAHPTDPTLWAYLRLKAEQEGRADNAAHGPFDLRRLLAVCVHGLPGRPDCPGGLQ